MSVVKFENLSTAEVAEVFSVSPGTVRSWQAQGCPSRKDSRGHRRYDAAQVAHWRRENQQLSHGRAAQNPEFPVAFPGSYETKDWYGLSKAVEWFRSQGRDDIADKLTIADGRKVAFIVDYGNACVYAEAHGIDFHNLPQDADGFGLPMLTPSSWDDWFNHVLETPALATRCVNMWNRLFPLAMRLRLIEAGMWNDYALPGDELSDDK